MEKVLPTTAPRRSISRDPECGIARCDAKRTPKRQDSRPDVSHDSRDSVYNIHRECYEQP